MVRNYIPFNIKNQKTLTGFLRGQIQPYLPQVQVMMQKLRLTDSRRMSVVLLMMWLIN